MALCCLAVTIYKEMELLMRGYMATDGNFSNQAGRIPSARNKERTAATRNNSAARTAATARNSAANAGRPVPAGNNIPGTGGSAYSLPESFDRLSSIVSQNDIESWMTADEQQQNNIPQGTAQGRTNAYNAAQAAYSQQTAYSKQTQAAQGQQTSPGASQATGQAAFLDNNTLTDEELALLQEEEEEKKKGNRSYGFNESDIEHMNSLLESMKRARERNKANNEKKAKAKKVLRYQFKKISGTISKAKNITQAGDAVFKAKNALVSIKKKGASGKYDANEIAMAETHARKMVRIAKVKLAHLKQEDAAGKYGSKDEISVEYRKLVKKSHRKEEDMELLKADMDYLKAQIKYIKSGGRSAITGTSVNSNITANTAIQAAYIIKKEAIKENLEEFLENSEFAGTVYDMVSDTAAAVSNAPVSAGGTIAASAVTGAAAAPVSVPSGGFTTMM